MPVAWEAVALPGRRLGSVMVDETNFGSDAGPQVIAQVLDEYDRRHPAPSA